MPKVPFPEGKLNEGALLFPGMGFQEKVIKPEQLKAAAGLDDGLPELPPLSFPSEPPQPSFPSKRAIPQSFTRQEDVPVYLKVEVYQRILGEIEGLRVDFAHLQVANINLTSSEYNEENNFTKLRKAVRGIHDRLLQVDKVLFKHQGD